MLDQPRITAVSLLLGGGSHVDDTLMDADPEDDLAGRGWDVVFLHEGKDLGLIQGQQRPVAVFCEAFNSSVVNADHKVSSSAGCWSHLKIHALCLSGSHSSDAHNPGRHQLIEISFPLSASLLQASYSFSVKHSSLIARMQSALVCGSPRPNFAL